MATGAVSQPGKIFVSVVAMLLGAYFLGLIAPQLMVLLQARVSASTIYEVIHRVRLPVVNTSFRSRGLTSTRRLAVV